MKKAITVLVALLLGVSLVACTRGNRGLHAGARIAMITEPSFMQRFIYDDAGNLEQIIEYDTPDSISNPTHNFITFNDDGSIASATTDRSEYECEVVSANTWKLFTDGFSITITYDENHFVVSQVIELTDVSITSETTRDSSGKAVSRTSQTVYPDMETDPVTITFAYDYDEAGNYIIQYYEDDVSGISIGETYAWE